MARYLRYKNVLIKDNCQTIFLFFNYFYQPKIRPYLPCFARRIIYAVSKGIFFLTVALKLHYLKFKRKEIEADWLIKTESQGSFSGQTFLLKENNRLFIRKKVFSEQSYQAHKKYYQYYCDKSEKIILPNVFFKDDEQIIKADFQPSHNLAYLAAQGRISFKEAIRIFKEICQQVDLIYQSQGKAIVHGDFSAVNLLISGNSYYLIDYLDSFEVDKDYDKYYFLRSIFKYFKSKKLDYPTTCHYLTLSQKKFLEFEEIYQQRRRLKKSV